MATADRVSRGFHRLALFLAAIPLLVGGTWAGVTAFEAADRAKRTHAEQLELVCAKTRIGEKPVSPQEGEGNVFDRFDDPSSADAAESNKKPWERNWTKKNGATLPPGFTLAPPSRDLKALGCSEVSRQVLLRNILDARTPEDFSYAKALVPTLAFLLGITLAVSFAFYAVVRAIGWVIGGFAKS